MVEVHHTPKAVTKQGQAVNKQPISWMRLLVTTALFSVATGTILVAVESRHSGSPEPADREPTAAYQSPLGLKVSARRQQVEIRWDHSSLAVLKPGKGLIKITEGETTQVIPLGWPDLQDGYISYTPLTNDVKIRFEVTGADGSIVNESARVVAIP